MSAQSNNSQGQDQQPLNNNEGEAVGASNEREALMAEFERLASRAQSIDARLLELHALYDTCFRGVPTKEESAAKPLPADRRADGRLRSQALKRQINVRCQIVEMTTQRRELSRELQDLMDRLSALGVTVESPLLSDTDFPLL